MSERQQARRRSFVSKPNFQLKLTIIFMLMVTIVANLVGGICYLFISEKVASLLAQNPELFAGVEMADVARFLIPKILLAEAISLCIVFILSILITHTIAGPVYRMEKEALRVGEGDLAGIVRLRPRDEFKELADAFNTMAYQLSNRIRGIREAVEEVEAAGDRDFSRIYQAFEGLKLAEGPAPEPTADQD